eukprot:3726724-Amphidinium_carterae.1
MAQRERHYRLFCKAGRHRSVGTAITLSWLLERAGMETTVLHAEHRTWAYHAKQLRLQHMCAFSVRSASRDSGCLRGIVDEDRQACA